MATSGFEICEVLYGMTSREGLRQGKADSMFEV